MSNERVAFSRSHHFLCISVTLVKFVRLVYLIYIGLVEKYLLRMANVRLKPYSVLRAECELYVSDAGLFIYYVKSYWKYNTKK